MFVCGDVWLFGCAVVWLFGSLAVWMFGCLDVLRPLLGTIWAKWAERQPTIVVQAAANKAFVG